MIVERLREGVFGSDQTKTDELLDFYMVHAADLIERLKGYALHDPACLNVQPEYTADYTIHFPHPCTCGLSALLKEIDHD